MIWQTNPKLMKQFNYIYEDSFEYGCFCESTFEDRMKDAIYNYYSSLYDFENTLEEMIDFAKQKIVDDFVEEKRIEDIRSVI